MKIVEEEKGQYLTVRFVVKMKTQEMMGSISRRQKQNPEDAAERTFLGGQFLHYPVNTNTTTPPPFGNVQTDAYL